MIHFDDRALHALTNLESILAFWGPEIEEGNPVSASGMADLQAATLAFSRHLERLSQDARIVPMDSPYRCDATMGEHRCDFHRYHSGPHMSRDPRTKLVTGWGDA